ncbi:hypothetical protein GCM10022393_12880 [Aquimarina addita]|uniref:DUF3887 domain-containing protein n=1 Tax=Aquimarina addita TaxID=870485 RepID=A0ABP7XEI5_9FLAO
MKKIIYFIASLIIVSCANPVSKKSMEMAIPTETILDNKEEEVFEALEASYSLVITEKLQDYLDKQILAKKHPEFNPKNEIEKLFKTTEAKEVLQVEFIGPPKTMSDSVIKLITKVRFSNTQTDTITSYITTSTVRIDEVLFKTSKITFKNN